VKKGRKEGKRKRGVSIGLGVKERRQKGEERKKGRKGGRKVKKG
jgi:hypothetical protein